MELLADGFHAADEERPDNLDPEAIDGFGEEDSCQFALNIRRLCYAVQFALFPSAPIAFNPLGQNSHGEKTMALEKEIAIKRTIRRKELRQIVPLADSTIYEMEQRGQFPRRFALTSRCVVWDLAEVHAWLAARRARPIPRAPGPDLSKRQTRPLKGTDRAQKAALPAE